MAANGSHAASFAGSEADLEQASRTSDSVRSAACAVGLGEHSDNDAAASQESTSAEDHENSVELALSEVVIVRSPYEPIDPAVMELWRGWPLVLQVTLSLVLACVELVADIILYVHAERKQMLVFTMVYASTYASLVGGGAYFRQRCCRTAPVQHRDIVKVGPQKTPDTGCMLLNILTKLTHPHDEPSLSTIVQHTGLTIMTWI